MSKKLSKSDEYRENENQEDIIKLILQDHQPLKKLLKVMKDNEANPEERREAFEEFGPLLVSHAKSEEQVLYEFMKDQPKLKEDGFEGEIEHQLADQLLAEAQKTDDEDIWSARVTVLAELVEHHIKEEENSLLPECKKYSDSELRMDMGTRYLQLKSEIEKEGMVPPSTEDSMEIHPH